MDCSSRFVAFVVFDGLLRSLKPFQEEPRVAFFSVPLSLVLNKLLFIILLSSAIAGKFASSVIGNPYSGSDESILDSLDDFYLLGESAGLASNTKG